MAVNLDAKIRNERRKLFAGYWNAIATAVPIGGSLPVLVAISTGIGELSDGAQLLMLSALTASLVLHLFGQLCLNRLEAEES